MGFEYSREGIELLAAGVLKSAYNELIDARLADEAYTCAFCSYNCHLYLEKLKKGKGRYGMGTDAKKNARQDIKRWEEWFLSEKCAVYCINVSGKWFIDIARKKAKDFSKDLIPIWQATPSFDTSPGTGGNSAERRRDYQVWKQNRDEWREKKGLKEVN